MKDWYHFLDGRYSAMDRRGYIGKCYTSPAEIMAEMNRPVRGKIMRYGITGNIVTVTALVKQRKRTA